MIARVSNLILSVPDLEAARGFYRDVLGLDERGASSEMAFYAAGALTLVVRRVREAAPPAGVEIVLEADDLDATVAELRSRGVEFRVEPRVVTRADDRELWATDFRDPAGHVLSVTAWRPTG